MSKLSLNKIHRAGVAIFESYDGLHTTNMGSLANHEYVMRLPFLAMDCCCFQCDIPVELRMIIHKYISLKTELFPVGSLEGHDASVYSVMMDIQNLRLFSASHDRTIKAWDTVSKTCIATLQGHDKCVNYLCLSHQNHRLYSGSGDGTIKVWDTETWQCIHTLEGHTDCVTSLVLDESTNRLYSASDDKTIKVWNLHTLTCIHTLQGHSDTVECLSISNIQ
jgi:WD40 repeat protein